jgi:hypothetical protein
MTDKQKATNERLSELRSRVCFFAWKLIKEGSGRSDSFKSAWISIKAEMKAEAEAKAEAAKKSPIQKLAESKMKPGKAPWNGKIYGSERSGFSIYVAGLQFKLGNWLLACQKSWEKENTPPALKEIPKKIPIDTPENRIEGLRELKNAIADEENYFYQFDKMMSNPGNDGANPPIFPKISRKEIAEKYPQAAAYLKAEGKGYYSHAEKIAAGGDYREILLDMEKKNDERIREYALSN